MPRAALPPPGADDRTPPDDRETKRRRLAELEDIYRHAPVGLCVLDTELRWVRINEYLARQNGLPPEAHLGRRVRDLLPELAAATEPGMRRVLATGEPAVGVEIVLPGNGSGPRTWEASWLPVLAKDGSVAGINVVAEDVTEKRRSDRALLEADERLRALMDAVPVGVTFSDDTTCERVTGNPAARAQFASDVRDNLSASSPDVADLGRRIRFYRQGCLMSDSDLPLQRAVRANAVVPPFEIEVEMPDGRRWFLEGSGAPVRSEDGEVIGGIAVTVDVTERRRIEAALRHANAQLTEASRAKDQLLSVVSHELRNPLGAMNNSVQLLKSVGDPTAPMARRALEILERQTAQIARLVDDLLDVNGAAQGRLKLQRERVDLVQVVERAAEDHRPAFDRSGVALRVSAAGAAFVDGDRARLAQVVGNLLHNASKFTPRGRSVRASVEATPSAAVFRVADEGIGLTPEAMGRIFEPFVQEHEASIAHPGGLGLGLAIVRSLVDLHGGSVAVRSDGPDRGSEFVVSLPPAGRGA